VGQTGESRSGNVLMNNPIYFLGAIIWIFLVAWTLLTPDEAFGAGVLTVSTVIALGEANGI